METHDLKDKSKHPEFYLYRASNAINIFSREDILPWDFIKLPDGRVFKLSTSEDIQGRKQNTSVHPNCFYYEFIIEKI